MIRNIVFDMGQVLLEFDPDRIITALGYAGEDADILRREVFKSAEWVAGDRGSMTEEEIVASVCRRLPERLHTAAEDCVCSWWKHRRTPIDGMEELICELKELGFGVYVLSNANKRLHEYAKWLPGSEKLDGLFVSADWLLLKPEREIFEKFYSLYGLEPSECFFVDDNPANIEGAARTGMSGAVFYGDAGRLRRELNAAGVPVRTAGESTAGENR